VNDIGSGKVETSQASAPLPGFKKEIKFENRRKYANINDKGFYSFKSMAILKKCT
jgi:hypothetical protein